MLEEMKARGEGMAGIYKDIAEIVGEEAAEALYRKWTYVNTFDTKSWKIMLIFLIPHPAFAAVSYNRWEYEKKSVNWRVWKFFCK